MESNDNSRDGLLFSKINFPDLLMASATKSTKSNRNHFHSNSNQHAANESNQHSKQQSNDLSLKMSSNSSSNCLSSSSNSSLSNTNQRHNQHNNISDQCGFYTGKRQHFTNNNNNNNNNNRNRKNSSNNSNQTFNQNSSNNNSQRSANNNNKCNYNCNSNQTYNRNYNHSQNHNQANTSSSSSTSSMPASIYYSNLPDKPDIKQRNYFKSNLDEPNKTNSSKSIDYKDINNNNKLNKPKEMNNSNSIHFQQAPFQPPAYHHHHNHHGNNKNTNNNRHKVLIEKYNHKFNLISFILLRKNDEYLNDYKYYFNDQSYYQQVDYYIEHRQLSKLKDLFLNSKLNDDLNPIKTLLDTEVVTSSGSSSSVKLANFTNSYNCSLFVYTVRKCLETESKILKQHDENNNNADNSGNLNGKTINDSKFVQSLMEMLFSEECRPDAYHLVDGDYPKRNIMHYASQYNCTLIPQLILNQNNTQYTQKKLNSAQPARSFQKTAAMSTSDSESETVDTDQIGSLVETVRETNEDAEDEDNNDESDNLEKVMNTNELVLIQLCMQTDFNGNTPAHLAAINNSIDLVKLIHPLCIKYSQLIYNDDGLNPFLLACRYSSIEFIQYLVESSFFSLNTVDEIESKVSLDLLSCRDKINAKNCLHFACGRGCGSTALNTVKYLTKLTRSNDTQQPQHRLSLNELIGAVSPLVGSIYHVAASNLTRLSTLWHLLELYPVDGLYHLNSISNHFAESILNRLDFREFTCIDCVFDSIMNLREMAPANCKSLSTFFNDLLTIDSSSSFSSTISSYKNVNFKSLLNSCVYKLLIDYRASIYNLPRVRNQWQLLEFCKLLVFMSKFGGGGSTLPNQRCMINASNFNTVYFQNFEAFCLNFLNKFIINGDLLPWFSSPTQESVSAGQESSSNQQQQQETASKQKTKTKQNDDILFILNEIMDSLHELTSICLLSGARYSPEFKAKLGAFFSSFLNSLDKFLLSQSSGSLGEFRSKLSLIQLRCSTELNEKKQPFSLKNLCRIAINNQLIETNRFAPLSTCSALSSTYVLFRLPKKYSELVNFLSFNLIDDLYNV